MWLFCLLDPGQIRYRATPLIVSIVISLLIDRTLTYIDNKAL